jgi:NAD(P)-dependent dehydrogenase (short-subunit alcohol dehydrogenase family)
MGLSTAQAFADAGASVVLVGHDGHGHLQAAAQELASAGRKAIAVPCDVTSEDQVRAAVKRALDEFGRLDFAYNNAGVQSVATETADLDLAEFDRVVGINLRGLWMCMKYELEVMRAAGGGAIVNCSSLGGLVGIAGRGPYHASKHGVLGLTKSAALEYAARGIRINAVCPGIIDTPMVAGMKEGESEAMDKLMELVPIDRLGRADEIAAAVLWLCSPASSYVIGHALAIDGGYTIQ